MLKASRTCVFKEAPFNGLPAGIAKRVKASLLVNRRIKELILKNNSIGTARRESAPSARDGCMARLQRSFSSKDIIVSGPENIVGSKTDH